MIRRCRPMVLVLCAVCFGAIPIVSQVAGSVVVLRAGSEITLAVQRVTPLGTVLDELCRQMRARCSGTRKALAAMVPAQRVSGDWRHVIMALLEGADLNYVIQEPTISSAGILAIIGTMARPPDQCSDTTATPWQKDGDIRPLKSGSGADTSSSVSVEVKPPMQPGSESAAISIDATPLFARTPPDNSPALGDAGQAAAGANSDSLLFPDTYGNPVPISHQSLPYLLFPDSDGNYIPAASRNSPSHYLPFPDSDGKLIPASNHALQYLLFPDSKGRLIPVPAATAH